MFAVHAVSSWEACLVSAEDEVSSEEACLVSAEDEVSSEEACLASAEDEVSSEEACLVSADDRLRSEELRTVSRGGACPFYARSFTSTAHVIPSGGRNSNPVAPFSPTV